jgi:TolA-binding protein
MQTHDFHSAIKAYTRFIDDYPTNKSLCSARVQRGIANQSLKNLAAAEKDYLEVIRKFDKCPEREFALQQEALLRGAQNDNAAMAEYFTKLLKDYPKTAAAAEAHYWIGRTAFENKDFKTAATHLTEARALDDKYFEQASLSLMQAYYFLDDRAAVDREVAAYEANPKKKGKVPVEVLRWLGDSYFDSKAYEQAEKNLYLIAQRDEALPRDLLRLGQARLQLSAFAEAIPVFQKYLESVHEPVSRATGLLELARAQLGARDFDGAQKSIDETLNLQPEGKISGEARIIAGDIQAASGHLEEAGKLYASVAVILDDDDVTPRALEKAYQVFQKAGREAEAKKYLNQLQSRYPEYFQKKKVAK